MAKVVRKQVYLQDCQERLLLRIAETRSVSQAEVVRKAIEGLAAGQGRRTGSSPAAWEEALAFIRSLEQRFPDDREHQCRSREDLYRERLGKHDRDPD